MTGKMCESRLTRARDSRSFDDCTRGTRRNGRSEIEEKKPEGEKEERVILAHTVTKSRSQKVACPPSDPP